MEADTRNKITEIINEKMIKNDKYEVSFDSEGAPTIKNNDFSLIKTSEIQKDGNVFINEAIKKCEERIKKSDYPSAATAARTLLETILKHIYKGVSGKEADESMKFQDLYKHMALKLNMHKTAEIDKQLKEVSKGLFGVASNLTTLRNKVGDAHGKNTHRYNIEKHHAELIVNSSLTLSKFLYESYKKQYPDKPATL